MNKLLIIVFTLILLFSVFNGLNIIKTVKAESTIYIKADGSVEGTDKIQKNGNVYTFTDNINGSITIEKDNVVVDGAGYILQGDGGGIGIDLYDDSTSITIRNLQIRNFHLGIVFSKSSYTVIESNYISNNIEGIRINGGFNNTVNGNIIANNSENGVSIFFNTHHNIISRNIITNNLVGVFFHLYSASNTLYENFITANNGGGIWLEGSNNRIIRNDIADNKRGVFITTTNNSTVYHNNFINNTFHVDIYGNDPVTIEWDNGSQGNHWDDYTGIDSNDDGIGGKPYVIIQNNIDFYPLMTSFSVSPTIPSFPTPTPTPTPPPTPTYTPTPTLTPSPEPEPFPTTIAVASIVILSIVGLGILAYYKKRKT